MQVDDLDEEERNLDGQERSVQVALLFDSGVNEFWERTLRPRLLEASLEGVPEHLRKRVSIEAILNSLWGTTLKPSLLQAMRDNSQTILAGVSGDVRTLALKGLSRLVEYSEQSHSAIPDSHLTKERTMLSMSSQTATGTTTPTRSAEDLLKEVSNLEQAEELFSVSPALQKEFGSSSALWHYCDAVRRGVVRWQGPAKTTAPAKPVLRRIDDAVLVALAVSEARAIELWRGSEALQKEFLTASQLWAYVSSRQHKRARIMAPVVQS
jgi:hypothetical protein